MKQKRVLILTDSLGCPRNETTVEHTWTDKILRWGDCPKTKNWVV